jgi:MFS family permease
MPAASPAVDAAGLAERSRRADVRSYWLVFYAMTIIVATGTVPVALYPSYAETFHFSPAVITLLASATTFGVMVAVPLLGGASDSIGRRPVLLPGLALGALSIVGYLLANGFLLLLLTRILSGFAVGLFTGAATATLAELEPNGDTRRAATHASTTSVAGFALGPLVGGLFVEYGPWPLRLVFVVSLVLLVPAIVGIALMRETMTDRRPHAWRRRQLRLPPPSGRRLFGLASLIAVCSFMTASFFQALGPTMVVKVLHVNNRAIAAGAVVCFLGTSAVAQLRFRSVAIPRATIRGLLLLPFGLAFVIAALLQGSLALFVIGALIGGLGQGLAYLGGQGIVARVAPAAERAALFSTYFVIIYVSGGGTAIALGLAAKAYGLHWSTVVYAALASALPLLTALITTRTAIDRRRAAQALAAEGS